MKKLLMLLMLSIIFILSGCSDGNVPNNGEDSLPPSEKVPHIMSVRGAYDDELFEEQLSLKEQGKVYYVEIDSEEVWQSTQERFGLEIETADTEPALDGDYFANHKLVLILPLQGSSSIQYNVNEIKQQENSVEIEVVAMIPEIFTTDIVNKGLLVGLNDEFVGERIIEVNLKEETLEDEFAVEEASGIIVGDLQLGDVAVYFTAEEVDKVMKEDPIEVEQTHENVVVRHYDGIEIEIDTSFNEVMLVSTTSDKYPTPRGLKVGDSFDQMVQLYGENYLVTLPDTTDLDQGDIYSYPLMEEYYLFHVEVQDATVTRITVHLNH